MPALEDAYDAINRFLASARQPAAVEPGAEPLAIESDRFGLELAGGRLTLHIWSDNRNLVRRITGISTEDTGRLDLAIERFGKQTGILQLIDLAKPRYQSVPRRAARLAYREQFRRSLLRQFPGGTVTSLSSDPDLQHSFSPVYPRALVRSGGVGWAAIGVPPEQADADGVLTFGLIWLDYLRQRERRIAVQGLALFIPDGKQRNTCLRLLYLSAADVQWTVFIYGDGFEQAVDLRNYGNVDTSLPVLRRTAPLPDWTHAISAVPGVETLSLPDGGTSWRVHGLEFAAFDGSRVSFGIETATPASASNLKEIVALAHELMRRRSSDPIDRRGELFLRNPESWLESSVRAHMADVDASLLPSPVYGQVPAIAGGHRGVIDLLACDYAGRLAVVEVKASEDLHLPLQALDYWLRVKWHLDRGEFHDRGVFPGIALQKQSPRMLLVAPALNFHPATEAILRYFPDEIEVERIGISMDWQRELKIAFRVRGKNRPAEQMWSDAEVAHPIDKGDADA
jgi:hypothetical protein